MLDVAPVTDAKLVAKRALGALYSLFPRPLRRRIVLLYHSIGEGPLALPETVFRAQMAWLTSAAAVVPLGHLISHDGAAPALQAAITFDDGYASLYSKALPVLREFGATATVFLNTGWIADRERKTSDSAAGHYPQEQFLTWSEVEYLTDAGWEIGSHGVDHLDLTVEPDDTVRVQLVASRAAIFDRIGRCSPVFSYTWGRHTPHLRRLVAEAGYTHAVAGVHGAFTDEADHFAKPRIDIARSYTLDDFKAIVRGDWDYLGWIQRARS